MYVYKITNKINKKAYIGITNNYSKRMSNHKVETSQVIDKAIHKYGADNFDWEIILEDISVEEAKIKEKEYILFYNTHTPYGYNISWGGDYHCGVDPDCCGKIGLDNNNAKLTRQEVEFIKNNRNIPRLLLYTYFKKYINSDYSYAAFYQVYDNNTYKDVVPTVDKYPYNKSFSGFFINSSLTVDEMIELRKQYADLVPWDIAYEPYKDRLRWDSFWQIYNGYGAKGQLFMPEIFTSERKKAHTKIKGRKYQGEKNPKAKLTCEDVRLIRNLYDEGQSFQDIYPLFPNVTPTSIRDICHRKTWKHLE